MFNDYILYRVTNTKIAIYLNNQTNLRITIVILLVKLSAPMKIKTRKYASSLRGRAYYLLYLMGCVYEIVSKFTSKFTRKQSRVIISIVVIFEINKNNILPKNRFAWVKTIRVISLIIKEQMFTIKKKKRRTSTMQRWH